MKRTIKQVSFPVPDAPKLTKVAAYARVSSGKDAMLHSLSAQVSYYNNLIQRHPGWLFCGVYADEALTGTRADRENFTRLLQDCRAGKVDMVITKSISRFARNTVTPGNCPRVEADRSGCLFRGTKHPLHQRRRRTDALHLGILCPGGEFVGKRKSEMAHTAQFSERDALERHPAGLSVRKREIHHRAGGGRDCPSHL